MGDRTGLGLGLPLAVLGSFVALGLVVNLHAYLLGPLQHQHRLAGAALLVAKSFAAAAEACFGLILLPVK